MGLPTLPAYLIIVLILGTAIQKLGVPILIVHLFVLYYGVMSNITPPVAMAAYAAAPICGANPMHTAVVAVRVALVGFIVPFVLIYNPSLTLIIDFNWIDFLWITARLSLAIWLFTTALAGIELAPLTSWSRGMRLILGFTLLTTLPWLQISSFFVGLAFVLIERYRSHQLSLRLQTKPNKEVPS